MFFTRVVRPVMLVVLLSSSGQSVYNQNPVPFSKLATCQEFTLNAERCMHFFPIESVKNYKTKENKIHLKFYVMAARDANIVLSSGYGENDARYTAVIGGVENTYSWISNRQDTIVGQDSRLPNILSPLYPTPIVVLQKTSGQLHISIPSQAEPLLMADAPDLTEVKLFCLYSWRTDSRWFFNCTEVEDDDMMRALDSDPYF